MKVILNNEEFKEAVVCYLERKLKGRVDRDSVTVKLRRKSSRNEEAGVAEVVFIPEVKQGETDARD